MTEVRQLLADNRLVTLTGAGGVGKTRLAVQVAAEMAGEFGAGVWYVDLAPITDPDVVPVAVARALGLPDQQGRSTMDTLTRFLGDRHMLVVLDNCEHLLDASTVLIDALLVACPALTLLTTSREPIGVAGEVSWRVPSLSLASEAVELFCERVERYQVLDQLTLLVDKSLVVAEDSCGRTRRRSLVSRARPTPCAPATATTTCPWRPGSTPRRKLAMSSGSSRPKSRSTTYAPRSRGAAKTLISSSR